MQKYYLTIVRNAYKLMAVKERPSNLMKKRKPNHGTTILFASIWWWCIL